jgi:hypothetical protein
LFFLKKEPKTLALRGFISLIQSILFKKEPKHLLCTTNSLNIELIPNLGEADPGVWGCAPKKQALL